WSTKIYFELSIYWNVIYIDKFIAHVQGSGTLRLVEVHDAAESKFFLETMEVGVDGLFLMPSSPREIPAVRALLESGRLAVTLTRAKVTAIRRLGLGDRVCVDTCSLLRTGEGLLVGNSSS